MARRLPLRHSKDERPQRARARVGDPERYRRSPALLMYWIDESPVCFDCVTARSSYVTIDVIQFLETLSEWTTVNELVTGAEELGSATDVEDVLEAFVARGLVQKQSASLDKWPWREWTPEAAFFHFGTRDRTYRTSPEDHNMELRAKARYDPPPPATKSMGGYRVDLPPAGFSGPLEHALQSRRTWRRFAARPTSLKEVGSLLHLTWGVQKWGMVKEQGRVPLKTSPSGGARHSIEAYVLALNVSGITPGVYHYDAATHELVDLERPLRPEALAHALANQRWFLRAGALVVMSAVFERVMWRYPSSRAYRAILTEAGHLGQTFCLVATAMNLAPFCTMAFRDRDLEDLIGVDGITESAMYVVGVGTRPRGRVTNPGRVPAVQSSKFKVQS